MKKFITITLAILVAVVAFSSCDSKKNVMENALIKELKAPSSYKCLSFEKEKEMTLADEVNDRLEYFTGQAKSDSTEMVEIPYTIDYLNSEGCEWDDNGEFISSLEDDIDGYRDAFDFDKKMISYLKSIENEYPEEYNKVTHIRYKLIYEAQNSFGGMTKGVCTGDFSPNGKLIAIRYDDGEDWVLHEDYFTIPDYYSQITDL